jgi:hypothetical protein
MTLPADTPTSVTSFARRFADERGCAQHLAALRWPDGFRCRKCQGRAAWQLVVRPRVYECRACGTQNSVTAGTVMHRSKVSLVEWFWAAWAFSQDKRGVSALQLSKQLGRRYETAWQLLHKLRAALAEDNEAFPLKGVIEVDETYIGGKTSPRQGGRSLADHRRSLLVGAVERRQLEDRNPGVRGTGLGCGSARLAVLPAASRAEVEGFVDSVCGQGATIRTDGLPSYLGLPKRGFVHDKHVIGAQPERASELFPLIHTLFSNFQVWLHGTFHGVSRTFLPRYAQEFTWRFNRRSHEPRLWCYLLRRAVTRPWVSEQRLPEVEPALQLAA